MATVTLELSEVQVVQLVRGLSPEFKAAVLRALIPDFDAGEELLSYGSARIRELCARRGIAWDALSEEERERLIDQLLHED